MCKLEKRRLEDQLSTEFPEDYCVWNREGGGDCKFPQPEVAPSNGAVVELFDKAYAAENRVGMDGVPIGKNPRDLEALAHALEVPWDHVTIKKLTLLESMYLTDCWKKIEANRKK